MRTRTPELKGRRLTFLQLFVTYGWVQIPLLQRDYAQGRKSAEGVRERFLTNLRDALSKNQTLNLDFVYGEGIEQAGFQPIDGQQRLTTLFLLHWFLAQAAKASAKFSETMRDTLGEPRFRYAVRPSSHQFFNKLLEYIPTFDQPAIGKEIEDQPWFFPEWLHDPTVVGALTMLDDIQSKFAQEKEVAGFYNKLIDPGLITMDVLNLGDAGISDEIYIKMNARGKELTGFEKFKAWLVKRHEDLKWRTEDSDPCDWKVRLDGDWLDLFWWFHLQSDNPSDSVSAVYFQTLVTLAVNYHAALGVKPTESWLNADADDKEGVWEKLFKEGCVQSVFSDLQRMSRDAHHGGQPTAIRERLKTEGMALFLKKELALPFFEGPPTEVTYEARVWLQAICVVLRREQPVPTPELVHWFRVMRNLLTHTDVNAENFANVISSVEKLGESAAESGSVLQAVEEIDTLTGFDGGQIKEERRKARLMRVPENATEWQSAIMHIEAHPILLGQIELLLPDDDDLEVFKRRSAVFSELLDQQGSRIGRSEYLLSRAVLAQADLIQLGWQRKINFSDSEAGWSVFMRRNPEWPQIRDGIRRLVDLLSNHLEELQPNLRLTILSPRCQEPWMLDIIRYGGELLPKSTTYKVQQYYNHGIFLFFQSYWSERDIMLGTVASMRNRLLWSLLTQTTNPWTLYPDDSWRQIELLIGSPKPVVFFTNHYIGITKKLDGSAIYCRFEYDRVHISYDPDFQKREEVRYSPDESAPNFKSFKELLAQKGYEVPDLPTRTVLSELCESCEGRETEVLS